MLKRAATVIALLIACIASITLQGCREQGESTAPTGTEALCRCTYNCGVTGKVGDKVDSFDIEVVRKQPCPCPVRMKERQDPYEIICKLTRDEQI